MQETPRPQFNFEALEADMQRLAAEVKRLKEQPEFQNIHERELVKNALETATSQTLAPGPQGAPPASALPQYLQDESPSTKLEIEYLLDIAFQKGVEPAIQMARQTSPFVLDAFHDALVEKLYPEMRNRELL